MPVVPACTDNKCTFTAYSKSKFELKSVGRRKGTNFPCWKL